MSESVRSLQQLCRLAAIKCEGSVTDAELLERFTAQNDAAAFEVLIWRYGPMVWGVCRRQLSHVQDAEDAFQATFLALVRRPASLKKKASLPAWLHTVAYRIALRVRKQRDRNPLSDESISEFPDEEKSDQLEWSELLDTELQRLPVKYRVPLVLSYLQGMTNQEIAEQLDCPIGTVFTRLARGREKLKERLIRRGITSIGGLATLLSSQALSRTIVTRTLNLAHSHAQGTVPANMMTLAEGAFSMNAMNKLKLTLILLVALIGSGTALLAWQSDEKQTSKVEPTKKSPRKSLRYGGKRFEHWQGVLEWELKSELRAEAITALWTFGQHGYAKEATQTILKVMRGKYESGQVETTASEGFRRMPREETLPLLIKELSEGNQYSQYFTIGQFLHMGEDAQTIIPAIVPFLDNKYFVDRVILILDRIDTKGESIPALVKLVSGETHARVKMNVIAIFKKFPEKSEITVPALMDLVKDSHPSVQEDAIRVLHPMAPTNEKIVPTLIQLLNEKTRSDLRHFAADYLRDLGPKAKEAVPALIEVLKKAKDKDLLYRAILALGHIGPSAKAAMPLLLDFAKENKFARWGCQDSFDRERLPSDPVNYALQKINP